MAPRRQALRVLCVLYATLWLPAACDLNPRPSDPSANKPGEQGAGVAVVVAPGGAGNQMGNGATTGAGGLPATPGAGGSIPISNGGAMTVGGAPPGAGGGAPGGGATASGGTSGAGTGGTASGAG